MFQNIAQFILRELTPMVFSLCLTGIVHAATVDPEAPGGNTTEATGDTWDATRETSAEVWEKTKEASSGAWDATRETSADAWEKTKEASSDAWDATRETSAEVWDKTKEVSSDAWDATREGSAGAWESTREWVNGNDKNPADETNSGY